MMVQKDRHSHSQLLGGAGGGGGGGGVVRAGGCVRL